MTTNAEQRIPQGTADKPEPAATSDQLYEQARRDHGASTTPADAANADAGTGGGGAGTDANAALAGLPDAQRKLIEGVMATSAENAAQLKAARQDLAKANGTVGSLMQRHKLLEKTIATFTPTVAAVEALAAKEKAETEAKAKTATEAKAARVAAAREKVGDLPGVLELLDELAPAAADVKPAAGNDAAVKQEAEKKAKADADAKALAEAKALEETQGQETPQEREARLQKFIEISDAHPGWRQLRNTPEFKAWQAAQPQDVQALGDSDEVKDAIQMLTLYKKDKAATDEVTKIEADRAKRLGRGEVVQGKGGTGAGGAGVDGDLWEKAKRDREANRATV